MTWPTSPTRSSGAPKGVLARLHAVVEAKDAENAELAAERELRKRLEQQVAGLQGRGSGGLIMGAVLDVTISRLVTEWLCRC